MERRKICLNRNKNNNLITGSYTCDRKMQRRLCHQYFSNFPRYHEFSFPQIPCKDVQLLWVIPKVVTENEPNFPAFLQSDRTAHDFACCKQSPVVSYRSIFRTDKYGFYQLTDLDKSCKYMSWKNFPHDRIHLKFCIQLWLNMSTKFSLNLCNYGHLDCTAKGGNALMNCQFQF